MYSTPHMKKVHAVLFSLLMITMSLAGCLGGEVSDSSDLEQQITDLQLENDQLNQTIIEMNQTLQLLLVLHAEELEELQNNSQDAANNTLSSISAKVNILNIFVTNNSSSYNLIFNLSPGSETINSTLIQYQLSCSVEDIGYQFFSNGLGDIYLLNGTLIEGNNVQPGITYSTIMDASNSTDDCSPASVVEGQITLSINIEGGATTYEILSISNPDDGDAVI